MGGSMLLSALRSLLFVLWMAATVVPFAITGMLVSLFVRGSPVYWTCIAWVRLAIHGARWICGVQWRVTGMEHLPSAAQRTQAVILLSKHQSTWFKRELLYIPFFGWAMSRLDMIHIDRGRRNAAWAKVAAQGKRLAAEGVWVIMFPEGTRVARGSKGEYKTGGTRLAVETGVPVVPIATNSARCWPRRSFLLRPGVIDVSIGKPISPVGREPAELMREVEHWIESEMRRIDPEAYAVPAPAVALAEGGQA